MIAAVTAISTGRKVCRLRSTQYDSADITSVPRLISATTRSLRASLRISRTGSKSVNVEPNTGRLLTNE